VEQLHLDEAVLEELIPTGRHARTMMELRVSE
jgi:hypothetical protein